MDLSSKEICVTHAARDCKAHISAAFADARMALRLYGHGRSSTGTAPPGVQARRLRPQDPHPPKLLVAPFREPLARHRGELGEVAGEHHAQ